MNAEGDGQHWVGLYGALAEIAGSSSRGDPRLSLHTVGKSAIAWSDGGGVGSQVCWNCSGWALTDDSNFGHHRLAAEPPMRSCLAVRPPPGFWVDSFI